MGLCHRSQFEKATVGQQWDNFSKEKKTARIESHSICSKAGNHKDTNKTK